VMSAAAKSAVPAFVFASIVGSVKKVISLDFPDRPPTFLRSSSLNYLAMQLCVLSLSRCNDLVIPEIKSGDAFTRRYLPRFSQSFFSFSKPVSCSL